MTLGGVGNAKGDQFIGYQSFACAGISYLSLFDATSFLRLVLRRPQMSFPWGNGRRGANLKHVNS